MEDYFGIVLRISVMYLFILTVLRLSGKRSIDSLSPLDFIVALVLGDMFDDVFWSEIPLSQGLVGVTVIILLHTLVSYAEHKSDLIHRFVASTKTEVVRMGKILREGLARERTSEDELWALLRISGEDNLQEIKEAALEPGGQLSVIKKDEFEEVQKKELPRLQELVQ